MAAGCSASSGGHGAQQTKGEKEKRSGGYIAKVPGVRITTGRGMVATASRQQKAGLDKQ